MVTSANAVQGCALHGAQSAQHPQRRGSKVVNRPPVSKDCLRYHECQHDSVNCFCFRADNMKFKACSIHVRARVKMSVVQLSCICLWIS